jgi:type II secretory pathway pseudopilin PulG
MKNGFAILELLISLVLLTITTFVVFDIITNSLAMNRKIEKSLNLTYKTQNYLNLYFMDIELSISNVSSEVTPEILLNSTILFDNSSTPFTFTVTKLAIQKIGDDEINVPLSLYLPEDIYISEQ